MKKVIILLLMFFLMGCQTELTESTAQTTQTDNTTVISTENSDDTTTITDNTTYDDEGSEEKFLEVFEQSLDKIDELIGNDTPTEMSWRNFSFVGENDIYYPSDFQEKYENLPELDINGNGDFSNFYEYKVPLMAIKAELTLANLVLNESIEIMIPQISNESITATFKLVQNTYVLIHLVGGYLDVYYKFGLINTEDLVLYVFNYAEDELTQQISYNYFEFVEHQYMTMINSLDVDWYSLLYRDYVTDEIYRYTTEHGYSSLRWFEPETKMRFTIGTGEGEGEEMEMDGPAIYIELFNEKTLLFTCEADNTDLSIANLLIGWELFEATGWDYAVLKGMDVSNTTPDDGIFVGDTNVFVYGVDRLNYDLNDHNVNLLLRKQISSGNLTDSILNLNEYGMNFNYTITIQSLQNILNEALLKADEKGTYMGVDFSQDDVLDQLNTLLDEDILNIFSEE